jgi:hypothetical protein
LLEPAQPSMDQAEGEPDHFQQKLCQIRDIDLPFIPQFLGGHIPEQLSRSIAGAGIISRGILDSPDTVRLQYLSHVVRHRTNGVLTLTRPPGSGPV